MQNPLADFLGQALTSEDASGPPDAGDATATAILDAALAEAAAQGLGDLGLERVARRAGVNRVTIYRRYGDRDGLISALAAREGYLMSAALYAVVQAIEEPQDRLVEGFLAALGYAREHPLIQRAAQHEPQSLISAGMADDARLLRIATEFLAAEIRRLQSDGLAGTVDADEAGETLARLFASFVLLPTGPMQITDEAAMRTYARRTLAPMVLGHPRT